MPLTQTGGGSNILPTMSSVPGKTKKKKKKKIRDFMHRGKQKPQMKTLPIREDRKPRLVDGVWTNR